MSDSERQPPPSLSFLSKGDRWWDIVRGGPWIWDGAAWVFEDVRSEA